MQVFELIKEDSIIEAIDKGWRHELIPKYFILKEEFYSEYADLIKNPTKENMMLVRISYVALQYGEIELLKTMKKFIVPLFVKLFVNIDTK